MTPSERRMLMAIAQIVSEGTGRVELLSVLEAMRQEDEAGEPRTPDCTCGMNPSIRTWHLPQCAIRQAGETRTPPEPSRVRPEAPWEDTVFRREATPDVRARIEHILAPAINTKAPYAVVMLDAIMREIQREAAPPAAPPEPQKYGGTRADGCTCTITTESDCPVCAAPAREAEPPTAVATCQSCGWQSAEVTVEEADTLLDAHQAAHTAALAGGAAPAPSGELALLIQAVESLKVNADALATSRLDGDLCTLWRGKSIAYETVLGYIASKCYIAQPAAAGAVSPTKGSLRS